MSKQRAHIKCKYSYLVQVRDNIVMTRLEPLAHEQPTHSSLLQASDVVILLLEINTSF